MPTGLARTEHIIGLHPKPCRRCEPTSDRLVSKRARGIFIAGVPVLTLEAVWFTCTGCDHASPRPRLGFGFTVLLSLVLLAMFGRGIIFTSVVPLAIAQAFVWGVWLESKAADMRIARRALPVPRSTALPRRRRSKARRWGVRRSYPRRGVAVRTQRRGPLVGVAAAWRPKKWPRQRIRPPKPS